MKTTIKENEKTLPSQLVETHNSLHELLRGVAASIRDDDRSSMHDDCALFEKELLKHLDWEEMYLLPPFEAKNPQRAAEIRADHASFRETLGRIATEIDIHAIRADRFDEFAKDLEAHSKREEALYATISDLPPKDYAILARRHAAFLFKRPA